MPDIEEWMLDYVCQCKLIPFSSSLTPHMKGGTNGEGESPSIMPFGIPELFVSLTECPVPYRPKLPPWIKGPGSNGSSLMFIFKE